VLLSGCAGTREKIKHTQGSIKADIMVTVSRGDANKFKKKCSFVLAEGNKFRLEIRGFFNEPLFLLTANGDTLFIYFYQSNLYYLEQVQGVGAEFNALLTGKCGGTFELKLKKTLYSFKAAYPNYSGEDKLPVKIELSGEKIKTLITLQEPLFDVELPTGTFDFALPKKAVKVNEEGIVRTLDTWIK